MSSNVNITVFNSKAAQEAAERAELAAAKAENIKFLNLKSEIPAPAGLVLPSLDPIGNPVVDGMFMEVNKGNYTNVDSTALAVVKNKGRLYFNQTKWEVALEWDLPTADLTNVAKTEFIHGKNFLNPATIDFTKKYSTGSKSIVARDGKPVISDYMPVIEGETYTLSTSVALPAGVGHSGGYFTNSTTVDSVDDIDFINTSGGNAYKFTVPVGLGIKGIRNNLLCQDNAPNNVLIGNYQIEKGDVATSFEPYSVTKKLSKEDTPNYLQEENIPTKNEVANKIDKGFLLENVSFNMIDPLAIDFNKKFSPGGTGSIQLRDGVFALSGFIPVEEDGLYCQSIDTGVMPTFHGGYFADNESMVGIQPITWVNSVYGNGRFFRVPKGIGIKGIRTNVICTGNLPSTTLIGNFQLERGEMPTPFKPFVAKEQVKNKFLPSEQNQTAVALDARGWFTFIEGEEKTELLRLVAPLFFMASVNKSKDLNVTMLSTSIFTRTDEVNACSVHPKANARPPLMHSLNAPSIIWDKMTWDNQEYRRYDNPLFFTETGIFSTAADLAEWDDGPYRNGWTRYSSSTNAAISFKIPVNAWQFNFIYRTDSLGVEDNVISVSEGNGVVQFFDESTNTWKELNGMSLSMRESAPIARNIQVPSPSNGSINTLTFATKGNTTYQKRLKMRCKGGVMDSRHFSKTITIQAQTPGRFMYWGVEWSIREFMITFINAGRGSHGTDANSTRGLPRYADNEVWGFKPDLLLFELPIHNDGASNASPAAGGYWWRLTNNYVFNPDYELSMVRRSQDLNGYVPEMIMCSSTIAYNFEGINEDGSLKLGQQNDGSMMTANDKFNQAYGWVLQNHPEVGFINVTQRWVNAGMAIYGSMKLATMGSGKTGLTFTNEGSHPNDTGSKIIAKALTGLFEFV